MTTMTLSIPEELKQRLEEFPEINWSAVARGAFMQKVRDLEFLQKFKDLPSGQNLNFWRSAPKVQIRKRDDGRGCVKARKETAKIPCKKTIPMTM